MRALITTICSSLLLSACQLGSDTRGMRLDTELNSLSTTAPNCLQTPTVSYLLPGDAPLQDQINFNCFAWQQFIAVNWLADPTQNGRPKPGATASSFGEPGDLSPLVWQSYKDYGEVFLPGAATPAAWNAPKPLPNACSALSPKPTFASVFISTVDNEQAAPQHAPNWLAAKTGELVWYEMLMNEDEFTYILQNGFYSAQAQLAAVSKGQHIDLPRGVLNGAVGSIELKAAWLSIDSPANYPTHKITQGYIYRPADNSCRLSYLALVGLHILHKTSSQPQWVWSTFEHSANAPNSGGGSSGDYLFYREQCQSQPINPACHPDQPTTSCTPNSAPAYVPANQDCPPYPVQVTRSQPIPNSGVNPVQNLNNYMQEQIRQANADSVWQHYQLINVLWSSSPIDPNQPGSPPARTPLPISGMTPDPNTQPVANTTLETYAQDVTCIKCHRNATIAASDSFASDFSFLLGKAQPKASNAK